MKRHWITTFVALLTVSLLTGALAAAETKARPKRGARPDAAKRPVRRPGGASRMPDVGLTEEQKTKIEGIRKAAMAEMKDAKPEERRELHSRMRKAIEGVFTEEQLAKLKEARQQGPRGDQRPDLGLTEEQKKQIAIIRKKGAAEMKKAKPEDRKAIAERIQAAIEKIMTPEQLEKLKKFRQSQQRRGGMPDIGMTDEQKEKMTAIRKAAMAKIKDAKPEDRKAAFEQMRKDIEALLTPEQLEKFKKARQRGPQQRGPQRDRAKGRGDRKRPGAGGDKGPRKRPASE